MGEVKIQWLGHSCMAVEEDGYRIVFDPYEDGSVDGLAPLRTEGDLVLASHGHADHNGTSCVRIRPGAKTKKNPFRITELPSYHDEVHGAKRGANTIRILDDGSYRIAHMGDIGCALTDAQKEALSHLTVMMVPVGGYFTLEPAAIHALVEELAPEIVIPMHYRLHGPCDQRQGVRGGHPCSAKGSCAADGSPALCRKEAKRIRNQVVKAGGKHRFLAEADSE